MQAIFKNKVLLEKFPGKGGWTYAALEAFYPKSNRHFGMLRVKGSIDHFSFDHYNLMPMGDGKLFLPVKKAVRKVIGKEAGDWVDIALYLDTSEVNIPSIIKDCFSDDQDAWLSFLDLTETARKRYIDHILASKNEEMMAIRIADLLKSLSK